MNEKRRKQYEQRLTEAESELLHLLERTLPRTAQSGETLFFSSSNIPAGYSIHHLPKEAEELFSLASECVELRETLAAPILGTVGQLYLSACREAAALDNEHRRGPRQLSAWLLGELKRA